MRTTTFLDRFWAKVEVRGPGECWGWRGATNPKGYGMIGVTRGDRQAAITAHRFSYLIHHGPIPTGMQVCHTCDNPPCSNPAHLWLGTASDNQLDAFRKGRKVSPSLGRHGEMAPDARLTNAQASEIRSRNASGETQRALAREFGVSEATVYQIVHRTSYRGAE